MPTDLYYICVNNLFRKAYDSFMRKVLYNILIEKARLIKMNLNETHSKAYNG
jgi:hypothetical protein